jgi:hypothetical protein
VTYGGLADEDCRSGLLVRAAGEERHQPIGDGPACSLAHGAFGWIPVEHGVKLGAAACGEHQHLRTTGRQYLGLQIRTVSGSDGDLLELCERRLVVGNANYQMNAHDPAPIRVLC